MSARPLLVVLLVVAVALPVGAVTGAPTADPAQAGQPTLQLQTQANGSTNASFGTSVASFMQASSAEAQGEVGQGMFLARFNRSNASERPDVVRNRVGELQTRIETLREQRAALLNDSNVTAADRAQAARLTARIDALQRSINGTQRAAERAGLDVAALDRLREDAENLTGQEIADLATGLVGGAPEDRGEGQGDTAPPSDQGAAGNESNASDAGGGSGPPDDGTSDATSDTSGDEADESTT